MNEEKWKGLKLFGCVYCKKVYPLRDHIYSYNELQKGKYPYRPLRAIMREKYIGDQKAISRFWKMCPKCRNDSFIIYKRPVISEEEKKGIDAYNMKLIEE